MHSSLKLILILLITLPTFFAAVNGGCSGRSGICIKTSTCSNFGGQSFSGKCPSDPNDVKCCDNIPCTANDGRSGSCVFTSQCNGETFSGKCPGGSDFKCCVSGGKTSTSTTDSTYNGPCNGGGGACINTDVVSCGTLTVSGKCPGANNVKCCVSGKKPAWYIDQTQHTKVICSIPGSDPVNKTVRSSGCGVSCLSMGISVTKKTSVSPETLFKEGWDNKKYWGDGFSHDALSFLGQKHGVRVTWTGDMNTVYNALSSGKGVIFHVGPESKYHFTKGGHYIFLYGATKQNGVEKVYVFDPNGSNNYVNVLFPLRRANGGIEVARKGTGADFGIVERN